MTKQIENKLNELSAIKHAADVSRLDYEQKRKQIMAQVQAELDALDAEYSPMFAAVEERANTLQAEIKAMVLEHGETVTGEFLQARYVKGRSGGYDAAKLDGYAEAHPEIKKFKKPDGEPSVSFYNNK